MYWLTNVALANAAAATLLAIGVFGISRLVRRPALIHLLWVLVLLKLVTPPLFLPSLDVPVPAFVAALRTDSSRLDVSPLTPDLSSDTKSESTQTTGPPNSESPRSGGAPTSAHPTRSLGSPGASS